MSTDLPIQMLEFPRKPPKRRDGSSQFLLRIPTETLDKVKRIAAASHRKTTSEIVMRLEASMENQSIDEHGVIVQHVVPSRK
jgi:hypothetical protein